jgi:Ca2+-binding RTX toxin-like protein
MAATTAHVSAGTLQITGDATSEQLALVSDSPTTVAVDVGEDGTTDFSIDRSTFTAIDVKMLGGDDRVDVVRGAGGPLADVTLDGGAGNDTLNGGDGDEVLLGGSGDDTVDGNRGNDVARLGGGADHFVWDPGDGSDSPSPAGGILVSGMSRKVQVTGGEAQDSVDVDTLGGDDIVTSGVDLPGPASVLIDAGADADAVTYSGTDGDDTIDLAANGTAIAAFTPGSGVVNTTAAAESLTVRGLAGADTITAGNGLAALSPLTIDGGAGDDTLRGGDGADTLIGRDGDDVIAGGRGADVAKMGDGDDHFQWDPGDGSDTVEGQTGTDTLDFHGANVNEQFDISRNGGRVRLFRNVAAITMDLNDVEAANLRTLGGADTITVGDLSHTGLKRADIDLGAFGGGGDGSADTVIANGTDRRDTVDVTRSGGQVLATGLAAQIAIEGAEPANDTLGINTLGGDDQVTVAGDVSDLIATLVDLGAGE